MPEINRNKYNEAAFNLNECFPDIVLILFLIDYSFAEI